MTFSLGARGAEVGEIHQMLVEAGEPVDAAEMRDKLFGPSTKAAIVDFQSTHVDGDGKQLSADGVVGPKTLAALKNPRLPVEVFISAGWRGEPSLAPNHEAMMAVRAAVVEIGHKEDPKTPNWGPDVKKYGQEWDEKAKQYQPWCFSGETEILTENGWVAFQDINPASRVAQIDPQTQAVSLTDASFVVKDYEGELVTVNRSGLSLTMDPGHRLFGEWSKPGRKAYKKTWPDNELFAVGELVTGEASAVNIPGCTGVTNDVDTESDRDIKILGAFIADGCIHRGAVSFQVSREWKIQELRALEPSHEYKAPRAYGPRSKEPLTTFRFEIPNIIDRATAEYKILDPKFIWSLSKRQARLLLDTFAHLDRSAERTNFLQVKQESKARVDAFHHLAVIAGYSARTKAPKHDGEFDTLMYELSYNKEPVRTIIRSDQVTTSLGKRRLYCATVPSGLIVIRPPFGKALIVGNCAYFTSWCWGQTPGESPFGVRASAYKLKEWGAEHKAFVAADEPVLPGDIAILMRDAGRGHVGIVTGKEFDGKISFVEGNCGNAVRATVKPRNFWTHFVRPRR